MIACPLCRADLDHCHGTLLVHVDVECTDPACTDLVLDRHELAIRSDSVGVDEGDVTVEAGRGDGPAQRGVGAEHEA